MIDYAALRVLQTIVQCGSFERAAQLLNVTPSAVSQRIRQLEDRVGRTLVIRASPCVATEKGDWLCRHMENVGILETELFKNLPSLARDIEPSRQVTLHIAANADSVATWFLAAAATFTKASDYLLKISTDDQEFTADWLARGQVIAAVTSAEKPIPGCKRLALGKLRYHATASPEFVARYFSAGVTPKTLAAAPSLTFNQKDRLQSNWIRQLFLQEVQGPVHWLPSSHGFVEACLMGMGWGMNPIHLVKDHLASGRLVELLPAQTLDTPLFWQINRLAADRLSLLTKTIVAAAERALR
ncbi:LysR family transcriptional regulator ArgP [Ochrobactrum quorumnocens]|uniref:LysR family transcriptional regulator ArgP n=1 Tax=Ochrobactrum quorumnocens TaxID=271865 RepID=UPI003BA111D7